MTCYKLLNATLPRIDIMLQTVKVYFTKNRWPVTYSWSNILSAVPVMQLQGTEYQTHQGKYHCTLN